MLKITVKLLCLLLLSCVLCGADQAQDLRASIDATLSSKGPIRSSRSTFLDQLYTFSQNRAIKKLDVDEKRKQLLIAYRDFYGSQAECASLQYESPFLSGVSSVAELPECLPVALSTAARTCALAEAEALLRGSELNDLHWFLNDQDRFLESWQREVSQHGLFTQIYLPSVPYREYNACLNENQGNETACTDLLDKAQQIEKIYGDHRYAEVTIGMSSKGPTFQRDYVNSYVTQQTQKLTNQGTKLNGQCASIKQSYEQCLSGLDIKEELVTTRIRDRNQRRDNLLSQRAQVQEYVGYIDRNVTQLVDKTTEAGRTVKQLEGVEQN